MIVNPGMDYAVWNLKSSVTSIILACNTRLRDDQCFISVVLPKTSWKCVIHRVLLCQPKVIVTIYEGCSNMNASSFITFFTYMLRQNVILFWKELFVAFKMAPNIKKHSLYFSSYRRLYKCHSCILKLFWSKLHTRFGICAYLVAYLC